MLGRGDERKDVAKRGVDVEVLAHDLCPLALGGDKLGVDLDALTVGPEAGALDLAAQTLHAPAVAQRTGLFSELGQGGMRGTARPPSACLQQDRHAAGPRRQQRRDLALPLREAVGDVTSRVAS